MSVPVSQMSQTRTGAPKPHGPPLPDPLERMLTANAQSIPQGQFLTMEGDEARSVFCLLDGWLSLSKCLPDGDTQIVDVALPGEIIEAGGAVSAASIEALTDARVAVIPLADWDEMKRQRPDLARISRAVHVAERARMSGRMLRLGRGKAAMRVAHALLELHIRLGDIGQSSGGEFHIPMNQRVLGDFVGLTSVHVCRTLGQLASSGIIRFGGHMNIHVLRPAALAEIAGADPAAMAREILPVRRRVPQDRGMGGAAPTHRPARPASRARNMPVDFLRHRARFDDQAPRFRFK